MSSALTDDPTQYPIGVYTPSPGETASSNGIRTALQQFANRTAYLKAEIENGGVKRIRTVADFATLRALTGMVDGQVAIVPTFGIYNFLAASVVSENLPWIVASTAGGGVGRWIHSLYGIKDVYLSVANKTRDIRFASFDGSGTLLTTSSTTWVNVPGLSLVFPNAAIGDIFIIDGGINTCTSTDNNAQTVLVGGDGTTFSQIAGTLYSVGDAPTARWSTVAYAISSGPFVIKAQAIVTSAPLYLTLPASLRASQVTP